MKIFYSIEMTEKELQEAMRPLKAMVKVIKKAMKEAQR